MNSSEDRQMNDKSRMMLTASDLVLIRQWFDAVNDLNPAYLTDADHQLAAKMKVVVNA